MKKIMIFEEKHGNRYFDVSTEELLHKVSLKMLSIRVEDGYFETEEYWVRLIENNKQKIEELGSLLDKLGVDKDRPLFEFGSTAEGDATSTFINNTIRELNRYKRYVTEYGRDYEDLRVAKSAIKEQDGERAYYILDCRRDYEYEGFDIKTLEKFDEI